MQGRDIQLMWLRMKDVQRHTITIFISRVKVLRTRLLIDLLCILMHVLLHILLFSLMKNGISCYRHNNYFNDSPSIWRWLGHWHHRTWRQHTNWLQKKVFIETAAFCLFSDILTFIQWISFQLWCYVVENFWWSGQLWLHVIPSMEDFVVRVILVSLARVRRA